MKAAIVAVVIIVLAAGGIWVANSRSDKDSSNQTSQNNTGQEPVEHDDQPEQTPIAETSQTNVVSIEDFAFKPAKITVKKGTKVTWTNKDSVRHNVKPDEQSNAFTGSELLATDESYSFTFSTVGTYTYHCEPHPQMTGTVEVTE